MRIRNTIGILLTTTLLAGCPSSSDDVITFTIPGTETPTSSRYEGNYLLNCAQDPGGDQIWFTLELSIQSDTLVNSASGFFDSGCTEAFIIVETTFSIVYPGGTVSTSLGEADFINLTEQSVVVDGEADTPDDSIDFDIILLDGNDLLFGLNTEELNGQSPETRPTEIDTSFSATRL